jgi:hypothetical protein
MLFGSNRGRLSGGPDGLFLSSVRFDSSTVEYLALARRWGLFVCALIRHFCAAHHFAKNRDVEGR